jgi:predicted membrane protein
MPYRRIKQPLHQGGYLELGEEVLVEADEFSAIVEVLEVSSEFLATWACRYTIHGVPPYHGDFEVRPEDRG